MPYVKKEAGFLMSKMYIGNPIVGRPIVTGYNWILTPASFFVGHQLKTFYSKFENILKWQSKPRQTTG